MPGRIQTVSSVPLTALRVGAFTVPTDRPESDGTLEWTSTTLVVLELTAGGETGLGYTYASASLVPAIQEHLWPRLEGRDALGITARWCDLAAALRNLGRPGLGAMAVSAVDVALWDLKARLLGCPLVDLLGTVRDRVEVYGSGGFTSYDDGVLAAQFEGWGGQGIRRYKMKVGREPERDEARVRVARRGIGDDAGLMVDANGAYNFKQALACAERFGGEAGVSWLEQPFPPGQEEAAARLRDRLPAPMELADGEYGYEVAYFRHLLRVGAADVVMPDVTRCGGVTGFLRAATLAEAEGVPVSTHCAPALHVALGCAVPGVRHLEWFHDHVRIEAAYFDGAPEVKSGCVAPDRGRTGHGLRFKWEEAEPYAA